MLIVGKGKFGGGYACIMDQIKPENYKATIKCDSETGVVLQIRKEDIWKLKAVSEESYNALMKSLVQEMKGVENFMDDKQKDFQEAKNLKVQGLDPASKDLHVMFDGIMRETYWAKPQTTIDMFTIKKHMQEIPEMQDKSIS